MDQTLKNDYQMLAESNLPFDQYRNKTFLVTGATGLIGSLLVKNLLYCNECLQLNLHVIAVIRNMEKAKKIFAAEMDQQALEFVIWDMGTPAAEENLNVSADYVIHTAAVTTSKDMVQFPVESIKTAVNGTMSVLEFARKCKADSIVYLSSMEVYGKVYVEDHKIQEEELGYVDLSAVRSCYPEGKRICECMCTAYAKQYGMNIKVARLAQTFGPGILPGENRVFAQMARSVIHEEDIVLHTQGLSEGNYVYTCDAIRAILMLLTEGASGEAYNVANEASHMSIRNMAEMVAHEVAKDKIKVVLDIPEDVQKMGYAPDVKMHLSARKLEKLGWRPQISLKETYERMIQYMKDNRI